MDGTRVLIVFDGHEDGLVEKMSRKVAEGARGAGGETLVIEAGSARPEDTLDRDVLIIGSPCHFAGPSAKIKRFMDATWALRGRLAGKIGCAFTVSEHLAGGHELTLLSTLAFFLSHGMIVEGSHRGDAFGALLIAPEGDREDFLADDPEECRRLGEKAVRLAARLRRNP